MPRWRRRQRVGRGSAAIDGSSRVGGGNVERIVLARVGIIGIIGAIRHAASGRSYVAVVCSGHHARAGGSLWRLAQACPYIKWCSQNRAKYLPFMAQKPRRVKPSTHGKTIHHKYGKSYLTSIDAIDAVSCRRRQCKGEIETSVLQDTGCLRCFQT